MQLRFVTSESTFACFEALQGYLEAHGCPVPFYADEHSVLRLARNEPKGGHGMTQFGWASAELNNSASRPTVNLTVPRRVPE